MGVVRIGEGIWRGGTGGMTPASKGFHCRRKAEGSVFPPPQLIDIGVMEVEQLAYELGHRSNMAPGGRRAWLDWSLCQYCATICMGARGDPMP